jgi:hypothetical protein
MSEAYATLVGPHVRDGHEVWALCCPHVTVSTDDVETLFAPEHAIGLLVLTANAYPRMFTARELEQIVLRELLGAVLQLNCPEGCGRRPYAVARYPDGSVRIVDQDDVGDLP